MSQIDVFTFDGLEFSLRPLRTDDSIKQWPKIAKLLTPMFALMQTDVTKLSEDQLMVAISHALKSFEELPHLVSVFAPVTRFRVVEAEKWVELSKFKDQAFTRKPLRLVGWLTKCLMLEYSGFLDENGRQELEAMVKDWTYQMGFAGQSGESSSAEDSE